MLLSVGESNLAYANTGLSITQTWTGPLIRWEGTVSNWKNHWANLLTPEQYNQADIIVLQSILLQMEKKASCIT